MDLISLSTKMDAVEHHLKRIKEQIKQLERTMKKANEDLIGSN